MRSGAWFWLAQTGAADSERAIFDALRDEPTAQVREEAVFALSQLPAQRSTDALIALVQDGNAERGVRERAMFWLAQSGDDRALAFFAAVFAE